MSDDKKLKIKVHLENKNGDDFEVRLENEKFQKMLFLYNAINDGWSIKKRKESYIFTKNHEGKKQILEDSYLLTFVKNNFDFHKLLA